MTESVVVTTPYLTVHLVSVIPAGINRVVIVMESVVTVENIVLVVAVQTTSLLGIGGNQEVHRSGDKTRSVVVTTAYLTVHLVSVLLTGINRVAVVVGMEGVVTLQDIAFVKTVQTTKCSETGMNQMEH